MGLKLKGHYEIELRDVITGKIRKYGIDNQLTTIYQNAVLKSLMGTNLIDMEIKYIALGTGTAEASPSDVKLGNETMRRQPTRQTLGNNYVKTSIVLLPAEAVGNINEIGVFCGNATGTADSGSLFSRINVAIKKTNSEELVINRFDYVDI